LRSTMLTMLLSWPAYIVPARRRMMMLKLRFGQRSRVEWHTWTPTEHSSWHGKQVSVRHAGVLSLELPLDA